jgi:hypothetical protein
MLNKLKPLVTKWYERVDTGEVFEVIAVDTTEGVVDVQSFEGDVAEMDMKTWREMKLERVKAPLWFDRSPRYENDSPVTRVDTKWEEWTHVPTVMH